MTDQETNFIRNSLRAFFQALRIIINRMEYYVIHVQFCMEFQNSFFQAHHLFPDTFYYQLLFDVLLENTLISDMLGIHAGIYETRRLNRSYCHSNLFMRVRFFFYFIDTSRINL